jgi:saccharopine dehydrogenase-like NADP-dependent oxidoreductase
MGPKLQYRDNEKDLAVMINIFEGLREGQLTRITSRLIIERSLETGLMAMSKGVGYPASIAAQMIAQGEITQRGILTPVIHVPYQLFISRLAERNIGFDEQQEILE